MSKTAQFPLLHSLIEMCNTFEAFENKAVLHVRLGERVFAAFQAEVLRAFTVNFENGDTLLGVRVFKEKANYVHSVTVYKRRINQRKRILIRRRR